MSNFKFLLSDPSFAPFAEVAIAAECTLSVTCGDTSPRGRGKGLLQVWTRHLALPLGELARRSRD